MTDKQRKFYHSKRWLDFRQVIIGERLDENGQSICEYCGKPIVKPYDLIIHHKGQKNQSQKQCRSLSEKTGKNVIILGSGDRINKGLRNPFSEVLVCFPIEPGFRVQNDYKWKG